MPNFVCDLQQLWLEFGPLYTVSIVLKRALWDHLLPWPLFNILRCHRKQLVVGGLVASALISISRRMLARRRQRKLDCKSSCDEQWNEVMALLDGGSYAAETINLVLQMSQARTRDGARPDLDQRSR